MKYHEFDNLRKYRLAREKGFTTRYQAWDGVDFEGRYENHEIRQMIRHITLPEEADVLVLGTGTGADSCWLYDQGYSVTGVDLIQDAIDIAEMKAAERGCDIRYVRDDLTDMKEEYGRYDLIVDSYCMQSIVMDYERNSVFEFIKAHLKEGGFFLSMCAGYSETKDYSAGFREEDSGIVYALAGPETESIIDGRMVDGRHYIPTRRHYTVDMYAEELESQGFDIVYKNTQGDYEGLRVISR